MGWGGVKIFTFATAMSNTMLDAEGAGTCAGSAVKQNLQRLLRLCQDGEDEIAKEQLKEEGYVYRLSREILRYSLPVESSQATQQNPRHKRLKPLPSSGCVHVFDNVFPWDMLRAMQAAFGSDSSFWREHQYSCEYSDYFSYLHPLNAASPTSEFSSSSQQPSSSSESSIFQELLQRHRRNELDGIIEYVREVIVPSFPEVTEARYAEWWAHCRPHESGHQFHFDSDNEVLSSPRF